jgi:putative DNA primase/helicase
LRVFFELHGRSHFEAITSENNLAQEQEFRREEDRPVRDRCGYRTQDKDGNAVIYVTPEAFRSKVCDGHSPDIMLRVARDRGALLLGDGAHLQKNVRLPDSRSTTRVYAFIPHKLE